MFGAASLNSWYVKGIFRSLDSFLNEQTLQNLFAYSHFTGYRESKSKRKKKRESIGV